MYVAAGVLALYFLYSNREKAFSWSFASGSTALRFWALHAVMGAISSKLIWGDIAWGEPRMQLTLIVLLASLAIYLFSGLVRNQEVTAVLNVGMPFLILLLVLRAGRVMHPINPVSGSTFLPILIAVASITFLLIAVAFLLTGITLRDAAFFRWPQGPELRKKV